MPILPIKTISGYTAKGYKLVEKCFLTTDGVVSKIKPQNSLYTTQLMRIETDFGKGHKNIVLNSDATGKVLSSTVTEVLGDKVLSRTHKKFHWLDFNKVLIDTKKSVAGEIVESSKEQIDICKLRKICTRIKLSFSNITKHSRDEHQIYEEVDTHGRKFIETRARRLFPTWKLIKPQITSNIADIKKLKKDPFLFIRNFDNEEFVHVAFPIIKKLFKIPKKAKSSIICKPIKNYTGYFNNLSLKIAIDTNQTSDKQDIVGIIGHEIRHLYQALLMTRSLKSEFNWLLPKKYKIYLTKKETKLSEKFVKARIKYPLFPKTDNKYFNNFLEVDARNSEIQAKLVYDYHTQHLSELFNYVDTEMVDIERFNNKMNFYN